MTDRGVIFSAAMVLALIAGRKTQTRRLATSPLRRVVAGDRLWARETFFVMADDYGWEDYVSRQGCQPDRTLGYRADQSDGPMVDNQEWEPPRNAKREVHGLKGEDDTEAWTLIGDIPAIYMPRWASRLTLIVEEVRLQPLHDITDEDAIAEGCVWDEDKMGFCVPGVDHRNKDFPYLSRVTAREMYAALWDTLHGSGEWLTNPDVVALTFRVERSNIDQLAA